MNFSLLQVHGRLPQEPVNNPQGHRLCSDLKGSHGEALGGGSAWRWAGSGKGVLAVVVVAKEYALPKSHLGAQLLRKPLLQRFLYSATSSPSGLAAHPRPEPQSLQPTHRRRPLGSQGEGAGPSGARRRWTPKLNGKGW